ncbi:uncharacterized protein [Pocillopora verrucosa]|uniref:uncharacterized protein n=1 Tax=Pocillopora verrucosa TaxID=203993 RepID=UPI0033428442
MSLAPKIDEIAHTLINVDADIALFTETWLSGCVPDSAINIKGYQLFRRDRVGGQHGGVCMYVKDSTQCKVLSDLHHEDHEALWAALRPTRLPRGFSNIIVGVVYQPPDANDSAMRDYLVSSLISLEANFSNCAIILAGDFNSLPPFGLSDHLSVFMGPGIGEAPSKSKCKIILSRDKRLSKRVSVGRFFLQVPWSDLLSPDLSCELKLRTLTNIINLGLNTIMPERSTKVHETDRPWLSVRLKQLIARRQKAFASGNQYLFKILRNKVNRERKRCRKVYYENKAEGLRASRPRDWWREVKQLCGSTKSTERDLKSMLHKDLVCEDAVLAEKINQAFVSVMKDYSPLADSARVSAVDDDPIVVTEQSVVRKLREVSTSRASGPDDIPNWVLKEYADILAAPIAVILNASFSEVSVPRVWKLADVPPLPKAPIVSDFNTDLRPISLTSTMSKIAESFVIEKALKPVVLSHIDPGQFGFIPGSSTTFALISMFHHWLRATDGSGASVRTALLDFRDSSWPLVILGADKRP